MELKLRRSLPNLVHLIGLFSPTLKHLQELLRCKNVGIGVLWDVPLWLSEKERPRKVKKYPSASGAYGVDKNILEMDTDVTVEQEGGVNAGGTDAKASLAVDEVVEKAQEEKTAALDNICKVLEPLAK